MRKTFFIYLMHMGLIIYFWSTIANSDFLGLLIGACLNTHASIFVLRVVVSLIMILVCVMSATILEKFLPRLYSLLSG